MIIEIRKAGFMNKGAELMLYAVLQKMKKQYPDAVFAIEPSCKNGSQPYEKFARLGMYPKVYLRKYGIEWGGVVALIPSRLRERFGLVLDREIDVVVDAAGFAHSDQWGSESSIELARSAKRWKKNGVKIILLPQAFGPFKNKSIQEQVKSFVNDADIVYAREIESYENLTELVGHQEKIKKSPDFTNLVDGIIPESFDVKTNKVCLIPNYRMIDKTSKKDSESYLPFMVKCAKYLTQCSLQPFILIHEAGDLELAQEISKLSGGIDIMVEDNPLIIKGIIGSCYAVIGSRFHGLVSALSQGVPALATGWSHKYYRLFEEYGFKDGIVLINDDASIYNKIDLITNKNKHLEIKKTLTHKSALLKTMSEEMWVNVFKVINENLEPEVS